MNAAGDYAGVSLYNPDGVRQFAVCDEKGPRHERAEPLLEGAAAT